MGAPIYDLIFADPQPWILGEGWLSAFVGVARLGQVIRVTKKRHDHVWHDLPRSKSDGVIAIGFDHHTPYLHDTEVKRDFWRKLSKPLLPIFYERIIGTPYPWNEDLSRRAAELATLIVYNCASDEDFVQTLAKPHLWQPFGVDPYVFQNRTPFYLRQPAMFFDGKSAVEEVMNAYDERSIFLREFESCDWFVRLQYNSSATGQLLRNRYNRFQAVLNPPSVYSGHTCRVWEALACGCLLFTPRPQTRKECELFESGKHLIYFDRDKPQCVIARMEKCWNDPQQSSELEAITQAGSNCVMSSHTLSHRLLEISEVAKHHAR